MLSVAGVMLAMVLRRERPEYGILLSIVVCLCIFLSVLGKLSILLDAVNRLRELAAVEDDYLKRILKMIGITYVAEFAVGLCKDAGYATIASGITMFSRLSILLLALPVMEVFLDLIAGVSL
jgi:stage III sporulation protein AD